MQTEPLRLADGDHEQGLIPGVAAGDVTARALAAERRRREDRRGAAGLPAGGLFDETARDQQELF